MSPAGGSLTTLPHLCHPFGNSGTVCSARRVPANRQALPMQDLTTPDVMRLRACSERAARNALRAAGAVPVHRGERHRPPLRVSLDAYAAWAGVEVATLLQALR